MAGMNIFHIGYFLLQRTFGGEQVRTRKQRKSLPYVKGGGAATP